MNLLPEYVKTQLEYEMTDAKRTANWCSDQIKVLTREMQDANRAYWQKYNELKTLIESHAK